MTPNLAARRRRDRVPLDLDWPAPPGDTGADPALALALFSAQLAEVAMRRARHAATIERDLQTEEAAFYEAREWELEVKAREEDAALSHTEHDAYLEVAKGSIERARSGAEAARNAAAAIGGLYVGVLGVSFAATDGGTPLPARGVIPAAFLGLAVAFATAYVALLRPGNVRDVTAADIDLASIQAARVAAFISWTSELSSRNAWALHAAVFSLGVGVASLPLPFVEWDHWTVWGLAGVALSGIVVAATWTGRVARAGGRTGPVRGRKGLRALPGRGRQRRSAGS